MDNVSGNIKGQISVIIPAVKTDKYLAGVVDSLVTSTYREFQLVVVCEGEERSIQRNRGIDRAKGEFLLFLDSDQMVSSTLLEECVKRMEQCDALYIPEHIVTPGWFGKFRNWERKFYTGTAVDCVKFIRNQNVPRYNENMHGPEDSDWDRRVVGKREITRSPLYHYDGIGLWKYLTKKAYYSKSMRLYELRNPGDKVLNPKYRLFTIFTENGKWKWLLHPWTIMLIIFLFARGIIYLVKR